MRGDGACRNARKPRIFVPRAWPGLSAAKSGISSTRRGFPRVSPRSTRATSQEGGVVSRVLRIGGAQMGPIQRAESRQAVVRRMLDLLARAKAEQCDLVVYPELALTTFFPRWHMTDQAEIDAWFEREMPSAATRPLFEAAA